MSSDTWRSGQRAYLDWRSRVRTAVAERRLALLRLPVIAALLALGAGAGLLIVQPSRYPMPLILLAGSAGLAALALFARLGRFEYGLLAIVLAGGLLNFVALPTGTQSPLVISLVLAVPLIGLWILNNLVTHQRLELRPAPINAPILAFVLVSIVAYFWANLLRDPGLVIYPTFGLVQIGALVVNVALPLLALFAANQLIDMVWIKWLAWVVIALGVLAVVSFTLDLPTSRMISNGARGVFPSWIGALAASQAFFNSRLAKWVRLLLLGFVGAVLYYYFVMAFDWFSGWLPLGLAMLVLLFLRSRPLFLVACVVVVGFFIRRPEVLTETIIGRAESKGDFQRLDLWRTNLDLVAQHPVFGVGPAGYAVYYLNYNADNARSSHNNYFDVVAQTGIVGLALFLAIFAGFASVILRTIRRLAGRGDFEEAFANAALAGLFAALAAMMMGDWVLPFAYNQTIAGFDNAAFTWILLGAAVSLWRITGEIQEPGPKGLGDL